jgi:hypothetical protein
MSQGGYVSSSDISDINKLRLFNVYALMSVRYTYITTDKHSLLVMSQP